MTFFLAFLTLLASIPPLLTSAALFQMKEWRMDRLREHLRREGVVRQLFGIARPGILGTFLILGILEGLLLEPARLSGEEWAMEVLLSFILLGGIQITLKKQPLPHWTSKAKAMVGGALILTALLSLMLPAASLPLLPIAEPLFLAASFLALLPLDRLLKKRVLEKALELRTKYPKLTVIGITGSTGKTTTKELLAHLAADFHPLATPAHVNTELGVAQWLIRELSGKRGKKLAASGSAPIAIIEMGAYRKGEIATLCRITKPTIGIVTAISPQHLALFGSEEAIFEAKGELLEALPPSGHAFLNAENGKLQKFRSRCSCLVTTVGANGSAADLRATSVEDTGMGLKFRIHGQRFTVPLRGVHTITNVLLAIACAEFLNIGRSRIRELLQTFKPLSRTFEVREEQGITILDDTHNSSPASFKGALLWAKSLENAKEVILLTSGLLELGEREDEILRNLGKRSRGVVDRAIFTRKPGASAFQEGLGKSVEILSDDTIALTKDSLLLCIGRMPLTTIRSLLPKAKKEKEVQSLFHTITGRMLQETLRKTFTSSSKPRQKVPARS